MYHLHDDNPQVAITGRIGSLRADYGSAVDEPAGSVK